MTSNCNILSVAVIVKIVICVSTLANKLPVDWKGILTCKNQCSSNSVKINFIYCCGYVVDSSAFIFREIIIEHLPKCISLTVCRSSLRLAHPHLALAVTPVSHPPPALTLSPRYVYSLNFFTSSQFSSCSTASNIPLAFTESKNF